MLKIVFEFFTVLTRFGASGERIRRVARSNLRGEFVRCRVYGGRVVVGKGRGREGEVGRGL
jgi:hypothetical protein